MNIIDLLRFQISRIMTFNFVIFAVSFTKITTE